MDFLLAIIMPSHKESSTLACSICSLAVMPNYSSFLADYSVFLNCLAAQTAINTTQKTLKHVVSKELLERKKKMLTYVVVCPKLHIYERYNSCNDSVD
jgi:hypothetical protein